MRRLRRYGRAWRVLMDQEFLERMVTFQRAAVIAGELFPDQYRADPTYDCRAEVNREGQPCRICDAANKDWLERVAQVRAAVQKGFS